MTAEQTLARLRAQNTERQRRYRERQKASAPAAYNSSSAERQRRYRERQKAENPAAYAARNAERQRRYLDRKSTEVAHMAAPTAVILSHVVAQPGVTVAALFERLSLSPEVFLAAVGVLVRNGQLIYDNSTHRLVRGAQP